MESKASGSPVVGMPARQRSRVSNGSSLFVDDAVDRRSGWARRLRDLLAAHVADLGGEGAITTAEHSICRRIAVLSIELELLERRFALSRKGASPADLDLYSRTTNTLRRCLEAVGLERRSRDVTPPSLDEIAEEIAATKAAAEVETSDAA